MKTRGRFNERKYVLLIQYARLFLTFNSICNEKKKKKKKKNTSLDTLQKQDLSQKLWFLIYEYK